jgi:hypothetical protein
MNLTFKYDKSRDVWCLLNKGKTSNNSPTPTAVYQELIAEVGDNPNESTTSQFIEKYLETNNLEPDTLAESYKKMFESISTDFQAIAERVFGVPLNKDITVYLTVNNRCPYDLEEGSFFVSISGGTPVRAMMHELWHFYTWEKFGAEREAQIGEEKYNNIKEALTVLLNVECKHLMPEGVEDKGYPQHQELRTKIIELWKQNQDIEYVWNQAQK